VKSISLKRPYWTFEKLIDIENGFGVRSTFFFLNESIRLNPISLKSYKLSLGRYSIFHPEIVKMIKFLDENGWEIGVHGSYNSFRYLHLLRKEKEDLEKILGHKVIGIRQHYLNLNDNTWALQEQLGFKYDSSWGFTNEIGFKENQFLPFYPTNSNFKVIPLTIMDTCFMSKSNRWEEYERLLDLCEEKDAVMVINFHQHVFSKYDFPGYTNAYINLIEKALKRNARFLKLCQI